METFISNSQKLEETTNQLLFFGYIQLPFCNITINSSDYKDQIEAILIFETEKGNLLEQNIFIWKDQDLETQKNLAIKKFKTLGYEKLILVALFVKTPYRKSLSKIDTIVDNPYPMIVANNLAISVVPTYDNNNIHNGWFTNSSPITDCTGSEPILLKAVIPEGLKQYLNVQISIGRMDLIYKTIKDYVEENNKCTHEQLQFLQSKIDFVKTSLEQSLPLDNSSFTNEFYSVFSLKHEELWKIFNRMISTTHAPKYLPIAERFLDLLKLYSFDKAYNLLFSK